MKGTTLDGMSFTAGWAADGPALDAMGLISIG